MPPRKKTRAKKDSSGCQEAVGVLQNFLDAGLRRDEEAMKACLTRKTLESGHVDAGGFEGMRFVMGDARTEGKQVVIPLQAFPKDAPAGAPPVMEMACLMVKEKAQWRFDLAGTMERMMGGALDTTVEQVATTMADAAAGVAQAVADGLGQALAGPPSESVPPQTWDDVSLTPAADEFLPLPELTPLPKTQAALSKAAGSTVLMQVTVDDLLRQLGSDERDGLINWFEDQFFAPWGDFLANAAAAVPLKDRLRAVRIEAASRPEERFLAVDGSDLVYRLFLNLEDGYYGNTELAAMLPGVLAGLPVTIDAKVAGRRLLATDEENLALDIFRERVGPRFMRRASDLVGHPLGLDIDWDAMPDWRDVGRYLQRWGLNRIYGAIALACLDPAQRESLSKDLKCIRIVLSHGVLERYARYEDGTLELGLAFHAGESGRFYEHELAQVLSGT